MAGNAPFRATLYFAGFEGDGWTENYWFNTTSVDQTLASVQIMMPARLGILDKSNSIIGVRVSQPTLNSAQFGQNRISSIDTSTGFAGQGTFNSALPPNATWTALQMRFNFDTPTGSLFFLRGLPGDVTEETGRRPVFTPAFLGALNTWIAQLGGLSLVTVTTRNGTVSTNGSISNLVPLPRGYSFTATPFFAGIPAKSDIIYVGQVQGLVGANGRKRVVNVNGSIVTVGGNAPVGNYVTGTGTWISYQFAITPVVTIEPERITERKTGRPFGVLRGRRRNVVLQAL